MTKKQAVEAWQQGAFTRVVEYRSGVAAAIDYRDKTTGVPKRFCKATHNLEGGPAAFSITEKLPDDCKVEAWVPPYKKGTMCLLTVESYSVMSGKTTATGKLEPLTD